MVKSKRAAGTFISNRGKGTRSECQAAAVPGMGKGEEKNGISLLYKAALG